MFAFSHFRVSACVLTAVLPSENAVAFSLQFYRVKTPLRFHCSFTEWKRRCVFTAVLPSGNVVTFPLQFYRVKTPLRFHCDFAEWTRRYFFTAVLPSRNVIAFPLQFYRAKTPLRFHSVKLQSTAGRIMCFQVSNTSSHWCVPGEHQESHGNPWKNKKIQKIPPKNQLCPKTVLGRQNASFANPYEETESFIVILVRQNFSRTRKCKICHFSDEK